jgi:hypothetical protein
MLELLEPLDWPRAAAWNLARAGKNLISGDATLEDLRRAAPAALGLGAGLVGGPALGLGVTAALQGLGRAAEPEVYQAPSAHDLVGGEGGPGSYLQAALLNAVTDPLVVVPGLGMASTFGRWRGMARPQSMRSLPAQPAWVAEAERAAQGGAAAPLTQAALEADAAQATLAEAAGQAPWPRPLPAPAAPLRRPEQFRQLRGVYEDALLDAAGRPSAAGLAERMSLAQQLAAATPGGRTPPGFATLLLDDARAARRLALPRQVPSYGVDVGQFPETLLQSASPEQVAAIFNRAEAASSGLEGLGRGYPWRARGGPPGPFAPAVDAILEGRTPAGGLQAQLAALEAFGYPVSREAARSAYGTGLERRLPGVLADIIGRSSMGRSSFPTVGGESHLRHMLGLPFEGGQSHPLLEELYRAGSALRAPGVRRSYLAGAPQADVLAEAQRLAPAARDVLLGMTGL